MDRTDIIFYASTPFILMGTIYFLGLRMSKPEKMMRILSLGVTPEQHAQITLYEQWLAWANLEYRTVIRFGSITSVVFQQTGHPRFLTIMFHQGRIIFGAETYFEGFALLDTGNTKSAGLFPRPGAYGQAFPEVSIQEVWRLHLEGEAYLMSRFGLRPMALTRPYEEIVQEAIRIRMKHNRSQFGWPVRVLYRYFVTRHGLLNRTVQQQYP